MWFANQKFCMAGTFPGILFKLPKKNTDYNQIKQHKSKLIFKKINKNLIMWDQFFQNCYFCSKTENRNIVTEFQMLELLGYSSEKQKSKYHHTIIHLN